MTTYHARNSFNKRIAEQGGYSMDGAVSIIESELRWLGHVDESEMEDADKQKLQIAIRMFYGVLKPINAKYIDGDEPVQPIRKIRIPTENEILIESPDKQQKEY